LCSARPLGRDISSRRTAGRQRFTHYAYTVRNSLEDLHAKYIPDELIPTLNRTVRNTISELLVADPALGWRLSQMLRAFLSLDPEHRQNAQLPKPVG